MNRSNTAEGRQHCLPHMAAKPLGVGGAGGFACQPIHSHLMTEPWLLFQTVPDFENQSPALEVLDRPIPASV